MKTFQNLELTKIASQGSDDTKAKEGAVPISHNSG